MQEGLEVPQRGRNGASDREGRVFFAGALLPAWASMMDRDP